MLERIYVWEFPVRLTHWINAVCIVVLCITGYYIGKPFIHATSTDQYIMGWMRFIHFIAGYLFTVSFLVRIYWAFKGNKYARFKEFFYFTPKKFREVIEDIKRYLFIRKDHSKNIGHTALASTVYLILWILFLSQILTGFALYSQSHVGFFWNLMGGWLLSVFSAPTIRLYHNFMMWVMIAFFIGHVYLAWFNDRVHKGGFISSIFSGYKIVEEDENKAS
jgi:Ni/Fe-hydrogenase 1 B-type cytochrome subunit